MKRALPLVLIALLTFSTVWTGNFLTSSAQAEDGIRLPPASPAMEPLSIRARRAVQGLSGQQIADQVQRDYPNWTASLPNCPCRQQDIANDSRFVRSSFLAREYQKRGTDYHPGGEYDYRQVGSTIEKYPSPNNPQAFPLSPGQQCIYDSSGALITRGPGAGTPDLFGPEITGIGSGVHTAWDVNPFHDLVGKDQADINNNAEGLRKYHQVWTPNPGRDRRGNACAINPPVEKRTGKKRRGRNFGDPHLFTYDGHRYSFQQVGEFVLSRSDDGLFEIQVRQSPVSSALAVDSAVAMNIAGQRVALYADGGPSSNLSQPLYLNGQPIDVAKEQPLGNGGRIFRKGRDYGFEWPTGEELLVQLNQTSDTPFLNLTAYVFESQANHLEGLLGNDNGDAKDDLRFRSGTVLASEDSYGDLKKLVNRISPVRLPLDTGLKHYLKRLTKDYGNDWRVSPAESLFDYAPGQSTAAFTLSDFPSEFLSLTQLSTAELNQARQTCASDNVEAELMEGCVFDVAFSGRGEFAKATARIREVSSLLRDFGLPVPDLEQELRRRIRLPWGLQLPKLPF